MTMSMQEGSAPARLVRDVDDLSHANHGVQEAWAPEQRSGGVNGILQLPLRWSAR